MSDWRPSAGRTALQQRATLLMAIREFFARRDVLEVETPLLASCTVTDPFIDPLVVPGGRALAAPRYLQTSPEYAMKRLLAAGSGPIFQIARAFRDDEIGRRHNPEFTLLEWYRPGFDHHELMTEVGELLAYCLDRAVPGKIAYAELFRRHLDLDPHRAAASELAQVARRHVDVGALQGDRSTWLDLLMTHVIEPRLAGMGACFVYDYPACQAALARIDDSAAAAVAQRFELYIDGVEIANGYHELIDPREQRRRFASDNARRRSLGLAERVPDARLLQALEAGIPPCSGVALGVDRLLMLACGATHISDVLAFDWRRS